MHRSAEQAEESTHHLASFISSFANMLQVLGRAALLSIAFLALICLQHVPDIEDTQLEHLCSLLGAVFRVFPQLYDTQRFTHYAAIARLFVALYPKGAALQTLLSKISTLVQISVVCAVSNLNLLIAHAQCMRGWFTCSCSRRPKGSPLPPAVV